MFEKLPVHPLSKSKSTYTLLPPPPLLVKKKPIVDITSRIEKLPDCLKMHIYKEFFEIEIYYKKIKQVLDTNLSRDLDIKFIRPYIPLILAKQKLVEYLFQNMKEFRLTYTSHKIEQKKGFNYMKNGDSFALSILMYMYH